MAVSRPVAPVAGNPLVSAPPRHDGPFPAPTARTDLTPHIRKAPHMQTKRKVTAVVGALVAPCSA